MKTEQEIKAELQDLKLLLDNTRQNNADVSDIEVRIDILEWVLS